MVTSDAGPGTTADVEALRAAADQASGQPRRRYGPAARALFKALDVLYGRADDLERFRVLEVVARVPYQAWEQVAFIAVTHTAGSPTFARRVHDRVLEARTQQDNELYHLLIIEELLDRGGYRRSLLRGRLLPQAMAFVYYQLSWVLYVARPRWSYELNADFEDHALHSYLEFLDAHAELETTPWHSEFAAEYGSWPTVADVVRRIALDELHHRDESLRRVDQARFAAPPPDAEPAA